MGFLASLLSAVVAFAAGGGTTAWLLRRRLTPEDATDTAAALWQDPDPWAGNTI